MDTNAPVIHGTTVLSTLDGVTTVLAAFLFVCLIFPSIVKNRSQYYVALACIVGVILLHTLNLVFSRSDGIVVPAGVFTGILQITALLMFVLSVGGLSAGELAGDMAKAYEVIRRGETQKEVIIPIGQSGGGAGRRKDSEASKVYHIDSPTSSRHEANDPDAANDDSLPM